MVIVDLDLKDLDKSKLSELDQYIELLDGYSEQLFYRYDKKSH